MKNTTATDRNRFFGMAECYDAMCRILVPGYNLLQDEIFRILPFAPEDDILVADLGAGSGIFLEKVLNRFTRSRAVWLDYSGDFQGVARKRLDQFGDRISYVVVSMEDPWENRLPGPCHCIASMSAIHHLLSDEKRDLYRRCFEYLVPGGWFFNIDEMKTLNSGAYERSLRYWVRYVEDAEAQITEIDRPLYDAWKERFDRWKERNVDGIDSPKEKGDDLHEPFHSQVEWLEEIGFAKADVFVKYHLWCLIGGQKVE